MFIFKCFQQLDNVGMCEPEKGITVMKWLYKLLITEEIIIISFKQNPCINVYIVYDCTGCIDHASSMLKDDWAA